MLEWRVDIVPRFEKAFDCLCVDQDILLKKMYTYDRAVKWFTSYLTGRVQICKINIRCPVKES